MQHELPMAVVDALGQPGRAGRVERGRLGVLVEVRKVVVGRSRSEQALIFADEGQAAGLRRGSVRHHDQAL